MVYVDNNGEETEFFDVAKIHSNNIGKRFIIDEEGNEHKVEDCIINPRVAEVNKTCIIIVEQGYVFIDNRLAVIEMIEEFVEAGELTLVVEDDSK